MKLLIGAAPSKLFHLKELSDAVSKFGIECKIVNDIEYSDRFPSRHIKNWFKSKKQFKKLIDEFKPDVILIDRQRHFGLDVIETKIPLVVHLRGDFWEEIKWARNTIYKSPPKKIVLKQWEKIAEKCFSNAELILPICNYLETKVKKQFSRKKTKVMYQGIDPNKWYQTKGMKLNHPCVGLLQGATIWGKTKEMLILKDIVQSMPDVTFYWVGDGPYKDKITSVLENEANFKWLGSLNYPDQVRDYLSEIDIYALISGIDMSPLTLQEAQLMKKPVIATNVGGVSELMIDKETGFLVEKNNPQDTIEKISKLVNDERLREKMGIAGHKFISENFSWEIIAEKFATDIKELVNIKKS
jgi:glycosyltransferase involved in cell wall biosynthesis